MSWVLQEEMSWWLERRKLVTEESEEEQDSLQTGSCEWLFGDRTE